MSREHRIKLQECYCDTVMMRDKRAELRINDRDYLRQKITNNIWP